MAGILGKPTIAAKVQIKELPEPVPRLPQNNTIEKMDEQEFAELQIESQAVVGELLKTYMTPEKCIDGFIRWVMPQWSVFWARFNPDGTMSWKDFEQFVQWEQRWQGDTRRVFSIFDPSSTGYISKPFVLEVRRKWHNQKDSAQNFNVLENFRARFANRWGTLGQGWRLALDTSDTGHCPQLVFMRCCQNLGMNRNLKTLWRRLTKGDISRSIVLKDLDPDLDGYLTHFALRLVTLHSTLRQGWCAICRAGGGHLHEQAFEQACVGLGIDAKGSKMLFNVLDPTQRRYLTEYDNLDFLDIWNPGNQAATSTAAAAAAALTQGSAPKANSVAKGSPSIQNVDDVIVPDIGTFEFELILTRDEYSEYLRRRRGARIRAGFQGNQTVGTEIRRKRPLGGRKPRPPSAPARLRRSSASLGRDASEDANLWHTLAPPTLGSSNALTTGRTQTIPVTTANSLGGLLSCPKTTG